MQERFVKIVHLYPKEMNLYGDFGNILSLKKRCEDRGIGVEVVQVDIGENIQDADIYFLGGGQDAQQVDVSRELLKQKAFLTSKRDEHKVFLGICGGFQLFCNFYKAQNGEELRGLGLLDAYTLAGEKRLIGNILCEVDFLTPSSLVGFENHAGQTFLLNDTKPLAKVRRGYGNNSKEKLEGARYKNVFGTYLHGPVLPKNPHFADCLIELALKNKYSDNSKLEKLDDNFEFLTHNFLRRHK